MHNQPESRGAAVSLLTIAQVGRLVGLSRPAIYVAMKRGFPRPVYPAPRAPRWRSDEIAAYIERLTATRAA